MKILEFGSKMEKDFNRMDKDLIKVQQLQRRVTLMDK